MENATPDAHLASQSMKVPVWISRTTHCQHFDAYGDDSPSGLWSQCRFRVRHSTSTPLKKGTINKRRHDPKVVATNMSRERPNRKRTIASDEASGVVPLAVNALVFLCLDEALSTNARANGQRTP